LENKFQRINSNLHQRYPLQADCKELRVWRILPES